VRAATPGYAGGTSFFPTYYTLGDHREAVRIAFDPGVVEFEALLRGFWQHNRKGDACGQLALWYHSEAQEAAIRASVAQRGRSDVLVAPATTFHSSFTLSSLALRAIAPGLRALEPK
jgi:peptide methionine sulfoxide reductase MsrA